MKVVIDGVEYAPVTEASPSAEIILRELVECFGFYDEDDLDDYQVVVSCEEAPGWGTPILELVASIISKLEPKEKDPQ